MSTELPISGDGDKTIVDTPGNLHAIYGLRQHMKYGSTSGDTMRIRIPWTGKAREAFEHRVHDAVEDRDPNGVLAYGLKNKTNVAISKIPEAKAMYALLTEAMRETDDGRMASTFEAKRDALVEGVRETFDRIDGNDLRGGADPEAFERGRARQKERHEKRPKIVGYEEDVF